MTATKQRLQACGAHSSRHPHISTPFCFRYNHVITAASIPSCTRRINRLISGLVAVHKHLIVTPATYE